MKDESLEGLADYFIHVLPFWGREHRRMFSHPYLHEQGKRILLVHPVLKTASMEAQLIGKAVRIQCVRSHHILDEEESSKDFLSELFFYKPYRDITKFSSTVIFVPRRTIGSIGSFFLSSLATDVSADPILRGDAGYHHMYLEFFYILPIKDVEEVLACCRVYLNHTLLKFPVCDVRNEDKLVLTIEDQKLTIRSYQDELDGPIEVRNP